MGSKLPWRPVLLPIGFCIKDDNIWFIQSVGNQLIKADIHSLEILDTFYIPWEESFLHRGLSDRILDADDKLLILLNGSNNIYSYGIMTRNVGKLTSLPDGQVLWNNMVICRNGYLYIFPYDSNVLLKYDYLNDCWEKRVIGNASIRMEKCLEVDGDVIISVDSNTNKIRRYHLSENYMEEISVGEDNCRYWGIRKAGDFFVLPHKNKCAITLWNEKTGEINELTDYPSQYADEKEWSYLNMYQAKNCIFIFPLYANMILKVDVENRKIEQAFSEVFLQERYIDGPKYLPQVAYLDSVEYQKKIYLYAEWKQCWQVFDFEAMCMTSYPKYEIETAENRKFIGTLFDDKSYSFFDDRESRITNCNFNNFIRSIDGAVEENSVRQENNKSNKEADNQIGEKIWLTLR